MIQSYDCKILDIAEFGIDSINTQIFNLKPAAGKALATSTPPITLADALGQGVSRGSPGKGGKGKGGGGGGGRQMLVLEDNLNTIIMKYIHEIYGRETGRSGIFMALSDEDKDRIL
jgi:hypothetical protein